MAGPARAARLATQLARQRAVEPVRVGRQQRAQPLVPGTRLRVVRVGVVVLRAVEAYAGHDLVRVVVAGHHNGPHEALAFASELFVLGEVVDDSLALPGLRLHPEECDVISHGDPPSISEPCPLDYTP